MAWQYTSARLRLGPNLSHELAISMQDRSTEWSLHRILLVQQPLGPHFRLRFAINWENPSNAASEESTINSSSNPPSRKEGHLRRVGAGIS